jgi:hypothetical protein
MSGSVEPDRYVRAWECLEERIKYRAELHGLDEEAKHAITILMSEVGMRYGIPPTKFNGE